MINSRSIHGAMGAMAALLLLLAGVARAADPAPALAAADLTDEHVRSAIDAIVEALHERKDPHHFWDPKPWKPSRDGSKYQLGGYTALIVHALLQSGQSYQDPRLRDAVDYLAEYEMQGTYAISLRASIWSRLPDRFRENLEADVRWLQEAFSTRAGGWTYTSKPATTVRDNSITQFGALALWDAAKRGVDVDPAIWQLLEERFLAMQTPSGGWDYDGDGMVTGSMTTAGLATLFITQDLRHASGYVQLRDDDERPHEPAMARGLEWMNRKFSPTENPGSFRDFYYYAWGVERVGLAGGIKHVGGVDWYREMAAEIIGRLCAWDESARAMTVHKTIHGNAKAGRVRTRHLAFSLMFLSRGRVPVAVNKLRVADFRWNNRPRDAANLARWITDQTEGEVTWQVVDLATEPEQWLDAPLLYLASDVELPWIAALPADPRTLRRTLRAHDRARARGEVPASERPDVAPLPMPLRKLERYLDLGGLLLAVNEGGKRRFAESIETFGSIAYPGYEWRKLPDDHWVYTIHGDLGRQRLALKGLSNGVRELIVLAERSDLAASLQVGTGVAQPAAKSGRNGRESRDRRRGRRNGRGSRGGRSAGKLPRPGHLETAANLYLYASELHRPRPRLGAATGPAPAPGEPHAAGAVTVVRAMYDGNWNVEPAALDRFALAMSTTLGVELDVREHALSGIHEIEPSPPLVVVQGTGAHDFTGPERLALRRYAERGGMVLFETAGGIGDFATSAEATAAEIFGTEVHTVLDHPTITGTGLSGGADLARVQYRPYSFQVFGARETVPRLRGLDVAGDTRVLFSREDLSHGLLDQPRWGISGYAPASARDLLGNIVRYAALTRPEQ
ncbi:MAG: DUF4159 domain-containing protein [Planctomycetes bacterium]|nr:DUF4159 domain-containing protein [Planctomycetota bacterium]